MLNEIRDLFRRSVAAFREELSRRDPEDHVADLLSAMRRELVAARAALPEYERHLATAKAELSAERTELDQCERRGSLAERIGDAETARVAREFAARHRERIEVLERKVAAADAELLLRRNEIEDMKRRYQEADANRFVLLAQLRRAAAREHMRAAGSAEQGPLADWERVAERVERDAATVEALRELDETPPRRRPPPNPAEVESRLRELKKRMGKEDG